MLLRYLAGATFKTSLMKKYSFDLDTPIVSLRDLTGETPWTLRDAVEGLQVLGSNGSGKTSSSRLFALRFLQHGFGGLVLTAKAEEKELWQEYCKLTGRSKDLVVVESGKGKHRFNFLEYLSNKKAGKSITENIVQVLKTVIDASEDKNDSGRADDGFWTKALDMLLFCAVDLCQLAYGKVTVQSLYDIVLSAPRLGRETAAYFRKAFELAHSKVRRQVDSFLAQCKKDGRMLPQDQDSYNRIICEAIPDAALLQLVDQFFSETYKDLSDKTRSIVEFSFLGFLFRLLKEPVHSLFCSGQSTFTPETCLKGKIILLNIPVKQFHKVGRDCQIMFKYIWQKAMEERNVKKNARPLFLWADEGQLFLHEYDAEYQATARSSRIATVYLTQNLPNYFAGMGGNKAVFRIKSFLGTLGTKVFHANADTETNRYASELIGDAYSEDESRTSTMSGNFSIGRTRSYRLERMVRPEQFVSLKTGGPVNNLCTEAYIHKQGNAFHNGFNHLKVTFKQDFSPIIN